MRGSQRSDREICPRVALKICKRHGSRHIDRVAEWVAGRVDGLPEVPDREACSGYNLRIDRARTVDVVKIPQRQIRDHPILLHTATVAESRVEQWIVGAGAAGGVGG
jgi:hypothetical protein